MIYFVGKVWFEILLLFGGICMNKECMNDMQFHWQVTVWTKWQIVIPKEVRAMLWINPWDSLAVITRQWQAVWLVPSDNMRKMLAYLNGEIND